MSWNNKKLVMIARIVLGLMLTIFGINGFLHFMTLGFTGAAKAFLGAIIATGYLWPIMKVFEIVIGLGFLFNKYTPLATVMLVPLSLNFLFFHLALAPAAGMVAYLVTLLNIYFIFVFKKKYAALLKA